MTVVIFQPVIGCALIIAPIPQPFRLNREQIAEIADQSMARHDAAGEEMLRDPIGLILAIEAIRRRAMAEYMEEKPSIGFQGAADALQQRFPIGHMLEHFDRNDAVEPGFRHEIVHIAGNDAQIGETARRGRGLDISPLPIRVGNGRDSRIGEMLRHPPQPSSRISCPSARSA
jgi:hypothetical protein